MTFHVHRASRLEALVDVLAALPAVGGDPFAPETFIIPTRGLERWLGMRLAERRGVFAHGRFIAIEDFLGELVTAVEGERAASADAWRPGHLVWHVAEVLRAVGARAADAPDDGLAPLRAWLGVAASEGSAAAAPSSEAPLDGRTLQLAMRIAEVFYRYALYRPDLVEAWTAADPGRASDGDPMHAWQAALWRRVVAHVGPGRPWPGRRLRAFIDALAAGATLPASVPERVVLFGHNTLAPLHLDALVAIAGQREVHLLRPTTSTAPDSDEGSAAHSLRASLDRLGSELDHLLAERRILQDLIPDARPGDSALARLQTSILAGAHQPEVRPVEDDDRSLRFHACHGALRQVEALRDELLRLFDEDPTLEPRDVCVMTPDIERFAPLIDAVFKDGERELPVDDPRSAGFPPLHRIHDVSLRRANQAAEAFLGILELVGSRLNKSRLIDLLSLGPVLGKTGLEPDDLDRVRTWLDQSGVRWGLDAAWRARFDQPETAANTWRFGFDRLLLGHALATDGVTAFGEVVPVDDVEGDESEVLGRVVDWLEALFAILVDLETPRTVPAWRDALSALVGRLIVHDDTSAGLAQPILDELQGLTERAEAGGFTGRLELAAVRNLLVDPFESRRPSVSFLSGGLTFCAMLPMRTVPFRVMGLLGMDDGAFPRVSHGLGFDLVSREPQKGDRSAREDDRTTFVETVLAARDHLIITWTGLRATDQRPMEPAGPVAELREAALRLFGESATREPTLVTHALQPFSPRNFEGDARSYDRRQAAGADAVRGPKKSLEPQWEGAVPVEDDHAPVALETLVSLFSDPAGHFCRQRLQFSLGERDAIVSDREPIQLNALEEWSLRDDLLEWELAGIPEPARARALVAAGRLPLGAPGRRKERQIEGQVARIAARVRPLMIGAPDRVQLDTSLETDLGPRRVVGYLDAVYQGARRVVSQASRTKAKHKLALWIRHLALTVARGHPVTSVLVAHDGETRLGPVPVAAARHHLADLVALADGARAEPLPLFPETSWAWFEAVRLGGDPVAAARDKWDGKTFWGGERGGDAMKGERDDPHVDLLFAHRFASRPPYARLGELESLETTPLGPFRATAARVLGPLMDALDRDAAQASARASDAAPRPA